MRASAQLWTGVEAAAADRHTIDELGMPSPVLMERAALCVSAVVERELERRGADQVLVLVGPGNNGGDGLAIARQLRGRGREVSAVTLTQRCNSAHADQRELARTHGVRVEEALPASIGARCVVVDAMLGTGSRGAPRGAIGEALSWLSSQRPAAIIAVDLPTGVDADEGQVAGRALRADVTVTFERSKLGLHISPARDYVGELCVAEIGLRAGQARDSGAALIDPIGLRRELAELGSPAHKGQRGHVGVIGGTGGTPGAAILAASASLRIGAGLATLAASDEPTREALVRARPELMLAPSEEAWSVSAASVLVVGPGLTKADAEALARLEREDPRPMVWDASALEHMCFEGSGGPRILTPHPGEAARLLARWPVAGEAPWTSGRVQAERLNAASRLAERTGAIVVLKGAGTIVSEGVARAGSRAVRTAINLSGGPALASAGTGDVLAGAIAGLLARGLRPWSAACLGVHLHGLAGDLCPSDGCLAMDVADALPRALGDDGLARERWPGLMRG